MNKYFNLPVGWRFRPDDDELIKSHLLRKVGGFPLLCNLVADKDLYGADATPPWEMFYDIDEDDYTHSPPSAYCDDDAVTCRKTVYVYTKLTALSSSKNGVRVSRRAGGGTWSGQSGHKNIRDSATGDIIGYTTQLTYKHSGADERVVGHWIMHEYSLTAGWGHDFVLCKITRCPPLVRVEQEEEEAIQAVEPYSKKQKTSSYVDVSAELMDRENILKHSDEPENILDNSDVDRYTKELEKSMLQEGVVQDCNMLDPDFFLNAEHDIAKMFQNSSSAEDMENIWMQSDHQYSENVLDHHSLDVDKYGAKESEKMKLRELGVVQVEEDYCNVLDPDFVEDLEKMFDNLSAEDIQKTFMNVPADDPDDDFFNEWEKRLDHMSNDHQSQNIVEHSDVDRHTKESEKIMLPGNDHGGVVQDCNMLDPDFFLNVEDDIAKMFKNSSSAEDIERRS